MKNPKSRTQKKSAQASRTITRQSALKDINRGLDNMNLITSDLEAHEIPELKLNLNDQEVFELSDTDADNDFGRVAEALSIDNASEVASKGPEVDTITTHKNAAVEIKAESELATNAKNKEKEKLQQQTTGLPSATDAQNQPPSRMTLPPKPFTIISSFRK